MIFQGKILTGLRRLLMPLSRKPIYDRISKFNMKIAGEDLAVSLFALGAPRQVKATTKVGRLCLRGSSRIGAVKIYEAHSPAHANFIRVISTLKNIGEFFPATHAIQGQMVIAEWVHGVRKESLDVRTIANIQAIFHNFPQPPLCDFDYIRDFIQPRFVRAMNCINAAATCAEVIAQVDSAWSKGRYLMHPDLTPDNIICSSNGSVKIVDNELISVGGIPLLDVCNTAYSLKPDQRAEYIATYFRLSHECVRVDDLKIISGAWFMRASGSAFVSGNLNEVKRLHTKYERGDLVLPFKPSDLKVN